MFQKICSLNDLTPEIGVPALINGEQVAIFRLKDNRVYAIANYDPFSNANVLARGITGNLKGLDVVASPMYKQHFDLVTGQCLEDDSISIKTYSVKVEGESVLVAASS
ncbi:MAG: nitrite reductase small subunit NirD [Pseudomonadota bacterium]|nr:nitrite reductase small subunit NirD [Pseudomonadota bacterium]